MHWCYEVPKSSGKYIVQTITDFGNSYTMNATLTFDSKNKPHWSFNNQKFKCYLKY
jgi:hypothetical protein